MGERLIINNNYVYVAQFDCDGRLSGLYTVICTSALNTRIDVCTRMFTFRLYTVIYTSDFNTHIDACTRMLTRRLHSQDHMHKSTTNPLYRLLENLVVKFPCRERDLRGLPPAVPAE